MHTLGGSQDVTFLTEKEEFACKYDCIKTLSISDKTLAKALEKNISYQGFYYKFLGSKLKCL
jgi:hypothetical protein